MSCPWTLVVTCVIAKTDKDGPYIDMWGANVQRPNCSAIVLHALIDL